MRMWMVDPTILCRKHLLGEHVELHMFVGAIKKKKRIDGFINNNCLEPSSIESRHEQLVNEMLDRQYKHKSPLEIFDISYLKESFIKYKVDMYRSLEDLISRCDKCKSRYYGG